MITSVTHKKIFVAALVLCAAFVSAQFAFASHFVFPSTNDENRDNGWAHVNLIEQAMGEVTVEFVSERAFASCFEYRTDGDTSQATSDNNYNPNAHGLYPFTCKNNSTSEMTFEADEYVEVRMVFGAEGDERFDWTRFDVLPGPQSTADCYGGGWEEFSFSSRRACVMSVIRGNSERDERPARAERPERLSR